MSALTRYECLSSTCTLHLMSSFTRDELAAPKRRGLYVRLPDRQNACTRACLWARAGRLLRAGLCAATLGGGDRNRQGAGDGERRELHVAPVGQGRRRARQGGLPAVQSHAQQGFDR